MKIKRILCALLASSLILTAASCSKNNDSTSSIGSSSSSVSNSSSDASQTNDSENPVPADEIAKFDNLIEEEYKEELPSVAPVKEYTYTSIRSCKKLLEADGRYYLVEDNFNGGIVTAKISCKNSNDNSIIWTKEYGANNITSFTGAILLDNGDIVLSGASSATEGIFANIKTDRDNTGIIVCLDKDGNEKWMKTWDEDTNDDAHESFNRIIKGNNNTIYLAGQYSDDDGYAAYIFAYDANGNQLWKYNDPKATTVIDINYNGSDEVGLLCYYEGESQTSEQYALVRVNANDGSAKSVNLLSTTADSAYNTFIYAGDKVIFAGRYLDENYGLAHSVINHDDEHAGTADLSYNRYAPGYIYAINSDGSKAWEYMSYGQWGGEMQKIWEYNGNLYAAGRRYSTKSSSPGGVILAGEMVLYELSMDGDLLSRKIVENSGPDNEEWFFTDYMPDKDGLIAVREIYEDTSNK